PVIASGGASNAVHLREGLDAGATGVLVASILHDGVTTVGELKVQLGAMGVVVRQ
ncbi:MAG TPA: imidazole glycerol phosphate synthase subunit HisF, partial [Actinobacteria bacterium]|nr:imidazole glycerol phosphate synthase subunit HisF [Actinomycetota bacterium]